MITAIYDGDPVTVAEVYDEIAPTLETVRPHIADVRGPIREAIGAGNVILEGAQGTFLDLDYGT
jgi:adenylosuccinate synthase